VGAPVHISLGNAPNVVIQGVTVWARPPLTRTLGT
jgi:hypothetical protein